MIRFSVHIGDTHCGSLGGLHPPVVKLKNRVSEYNRVQEIVYNEGWRPFWDKFVPDVTQGNDFIVVHGGDVVDGFHHNTHEIVSSSLGDQKRIAIEVLKPEFAKAKKCFFVGGTGCHSGQLWNEEDDIARDLGAEMNDDGYCVHTTARLNLNGKLIDDNHHIGQTTRGPSEKNALRGEIDDCFSNSARYGERVPDVVVRHHVHRLDVVPVTGNVKRYGVIVGGWQVGGQHVGRIKAIKNRPMEVSAVIIEVSEDGKDITIHEYFKLFPKLRPKIINV